MLSYGPHSGAEVELARVQKKGDRRAA